MTSQKIDPYNPHGGLAPRRETPRIRLARPDMGLEEADAVARVLGSGVLTNGPETAAFEAEFAARHGVEHAVAMSNGTVALAALYIALDIGPGDEVIVPSLTFISTATSVLHVGATAVFADVDPETFNLDPTDVAKRITPATKAIVAVHYAGQSADMDELQAVADEAGIVLLEDAAEAHGAIYRGSSVGSLGRAAMFSFTPTKNITTGEGGMVTTADGDLARTLRLLRNHGQSAQYRHDTLGWNWRLTEMQAAIGRCQVAKLDAILDRKRANAQVLGALLDDVTGVTAPVVRRDRDHVFMLYTTLIDEGRDDLLASLADQGIEARLYFPPAHSQPVFASGAVHLPVTEHLAEHMMSVPFHSLLRPDELTEIAEALRH